MKASFVGWWFAAFGSRRFASPQAVRPAEKFSKKAFGLLGSFYAPRPPVLF